MTCEGPDGKGISAPPAVKDNNDGTYDVTYTPEQAGSNKVMVKLNGNPIKDAPFGVAVVAGDPDPDNTTAEGPGLAHASVGAPASFHVQARDRCGNPCALGAAKVDIEVVGILFQCLFILLRFVFTMYAQDPAVRRQQLLPPSTTPPAMCPFYSFYYYRPPFFFFHWSDLPRFGIDSGILCA